MTEERAEWRVGRLGLGLLFALALLLRVGLAIDYERNHPLADLPVIDEASYETWATEIAGGDWVGDEVFFQDPLYPYWMGAIHAVWGGGDGPQSRLQRRTATRHIQALYGAVAVVLLTLVTARLFGARAGWLAGFAMAVYRPLVYFPALLLKPNLLVPLLALLIWLTLLARDSRGRRGLFAWGAVGLCAGLGALLRGNLLLLLPVFALLPLLRARQEGGALRGALAACAVVLGAMLLVLLPVAARNHAVGGMFALTTSGPGTNLYGGNNAENPYGRATEFSWVRGVPEHEAQDWKNEAERRTGRMLDAGEVSSFWIGETLASVRADPGLHLSILWNKLRLSLGAYEVPDNHHLGWDAGWVSGLRLPLPGFGVLGALGLGGLLAFLARRLCGAPRPRDPRGALELAGLFLLYLATVVLTLTSMRIRLALVPLLLPFAGYLVDGILSRAPLRSWAPTLSLAVLIVHWPTLSVEQRAEDLLKRDYNHAVVLLAEGRLDEAQELHARLAGQRPGTISVNLLGAELAYREGVQLGLAGAQAAEIEARLDLALGLLEPVATRDETPARDRFRAQKLAGLIHFDFKSYEVAEDRFREALAFDPADPDVLFRLANILWIRAPGLEGEARLGTLIEARNILTGLSAVPGAGERLAEVEAALAE